MFKLNTGNVLSFGEKYIMICIEGKSSLTFNFGNALHVESPNEKNFTYSSALSSIEINMLTTEVKLTTKHINTKTYVINTTAYCDRIEYPYSLVALIIDQKDDVTVKSKSNMVNNLMCYTKKRKNKVCQCDITIKRVALFGPVDTKIPGLHSVFKVCNNKKRLHACAIDDIKLML
jgi:hypothetical protein